MKTELFGIVLLLAMLDTAWALPRLNWVDTSNDEDGFSIERTTDDPTCATGFVEVGLTAENVTTWTDLIAIDKACYRVLAFNENGDSGYSNVVQYLAPLPPPPCRPKGKSGKCR